MTNGRMRNFSPPRRREISPHSLFSFDDMSAEPRCWPRSSSTAATMRRTSPRKRFSSSIEARASLMLRAHSRRGSLRSSEGLPRIGGLERYDGQDCFSCGSGCAALSPALNQQRPPFTPVLTPDRPPERSSRCRRCSARVSNWSSSEACRQRRSRRCMTSASRPSDSMSFAPGRHSGIGCVRQTSQSHDNA